MLIPLYTQLIEFKMAHFGTRGNIYFGKGVNPIFKEMRQTIIMINKILKELMIEFPGKKGSPIKGGSSGDSINGDGDYYDNMMNGNKPKRKRTIKKRKNNG